MLLMMCLKNIMICSVKLKATKIRDAILDWLGITRQVNEETREITYKYEYVNMSFKELQTQWLQN